MSRPAELRKALEVVVLRPTTTISEVEEVCVSARHAHVAALCVMPALVAAARAALAGSDVKLVALISFPFGADEPAIKQAAARGALDAGADEVEVMFALSAFLSGDVNAARDELAVIVTEARTRPRPALVRGVIEASYLDDRRLRLAARVLRAARVDMAVTSSGLGPKTASPLDVELLREELGAHIMIKAAGSVRSSDEVRALISAGAARVGVADPEAVLATSRTA